MTVTIAPLTERDFFAWYELFAAYAATAGVQATDETVMRVWTTVTGSDGGALVAKDDSGAVVGLLHHRGFERLVDGAQGLQIEDVYVAEGARRAGVATALVEHVRTRAESQRRPLLRWTARDGDPAASALQQRFAPSTAGWSLHELPVG